MFAITGKAVTDTVTAATTDLNDRTIWEGHPPSLLFLYTFQYCNFDFPGYINILMKTLSLTIISDNTPHAPFQAEHGLALALETDKGEKILFDTGCGETFFPHLELLDLDPASFPHLFLSHGHYDHTGALAPLLEKAPHLQVWYGKGAEKERFSCHKGVPAKKISMPEPCRKALEKHPLQTVLATPMAMGNGFFLTGEIPRNTAEDTGGPFYFDPEKKEADLIADERALLWEGGVLLQGCCHAGIGNTLEYCRKNFSHIPIHTVIGGLHLKDAGKERLESTKEFLLASGIKRLVLLHCTGEKGMDYLKNTLSSSLEILTPHAGEKLTLTEKGDLL